MDIYITSTVSRHLAHLSGKPVGFVLILFKPFSSPSVPVLLHHRLQQSTVWITTPSPVCFSVMQSASPPPFSRPFHSVWGGNIPPHPALSVYRSGADPAIGDCFILICY